MFKQPEQEFKYTFARYFRGADYDIDHSLVIAKFRGRLPVSRQLC
jgi:hypothetical protein